MMKVEKSGERIGRAARVASWPAIESALRRDRVLNLRGRCRALLRKYYVDGVYPVEAETEIGLGGDHRGIEYLLCEPNASVERWRELKYGGGSHRTFSIASLGHLQENTEQFYFGDNSIFARREHEIYDFFYRDLLIGELEDTYRAQWRSRGASLGRHVQGAIDHARRIRPNPFMVGWRDAECFFETTSTIDLEPTYYASSGRLALDLWGIGQMRLSLAHPEKFNEFALRIAKGVDEFLRDRHGPSGLWGLYADCGLEQIEQIAEQSLVGGTAHICIRYDSAEQLDAMVPQLRCATRFPCNGEACPDVALALPSADARPDRVSLIALEHLWRCGFEPLEVDALDSRTLFLTVVMPTGLREFQQACYSLVCDLTHLEERLKARKTEPEDVFMSFDRFARAIMIVEPLHGEPRVRAFGRGSPDVPGLEDGTGVSSYAIGEVKVSALADAASVTDKRKPMQKRLLELLDNRFVEVARGGIDSLDYMNMEHEVFSSLFRKYVREDSL